MTIDNVRRQAWHYVSHETAQAAEMTLAQLQQFIAGTFHPTKRQVQLLANRMGMMR